MRSLAPIGRVGEKRSGRYASSGKGFPPSPREALESGAVVNAGWRKPRPYVRFDPLTYSRQNGATTEGKADAAGQETASQGAANQDTAVQGTAIQGALDQGAVDQGAVDQGESGQIKGERISRSNSPTETMMSAVGDPTGVAGGGEFAASTGSDLINTIGQREAATTADTNAATSDAADQGEEVHLPDGQSIPDTKSPTG